MTEIEQPPQNGIDVTTEDDENNKARPADIEQDMREMERRKRVEAIMGSKLFREELERIVDSAREGGTTGILQQLSDIVGLPSSRLGNVLKASNCMVPINDIRGIESMGYAKGEKILRCKLAATFRLLDLYGWTHGLGSQVTARLKVDQEIFLVNPYGMLYHEITASSLNKVDMQAQVVEQGTTNFGVNKNHFILHSIVHAARPDIRCAIYIGCSPVVAVSALKIGLLPITLDACVLGEITTHSFSGSLIQTEERDKLVRNLGPNSKVILLTNHGALCCGESIEEAFFLACHIVHACETQLKLLPIGVENIVLISEESRKDIYEQARRPPEDLEKKFAAALANIEKTPTTIGEEDNKNDIATKTAASAQKAPNWRVGGAEFEALMRMLDNAGYRTGYIYRHPLVKSELPKPKNDVELPPAVSSLGYLLEEEELYRQGIWKKGDPRKSGDRCRWLNSPNVYQKVEVLETGTPDPKKITKWIAEGSPTHGTPVRIEDALQFVPAGTNTKEFKRVQQQIKDNRRADKISAGPQSQILEGVTWDEANRIKDATVSSAGDHVVLMGAASKGIIQRGFQHNATVYKTPYAKNPFDNVTDDELNEYKRTVERKKKSIHGEYTDTDFSETEALSSVHASAGPTLMKHSVATINHSEPEDVSEHQVMRIETQQAPVPSQPEVILSDATLDFINSERSHTSTNRKTTTGKDLNQVLQDEISQKYQDHLLDDVAGNKENIFAGNQNINRNKELVADLKKDLLFQRQKEQLVTSPNKSNDGSFSRNLTITTNKSNEPISITNRITKENKKEYHKNTSVLSNPNMTHAINKSLLDRATQYKSNEYCLNFVPYSYSSVATRSNYCSEIALARSKLLNNESIRLTDIKSPNESLESQRLYTKSVFCYTPNVCDSVFESLQRPLENDLILNIPFTIPIQMSTSLASPRKGYSQLDNQTSSPTNCPYRTLSHFGFNSPQSLPKPEHKHIPHELITKYVPLIKSTSYEEIFSSPRYVDLCENCFEKIVRLKPELVYMKTRLRNIVDFNSGNKIDGNEIVKCGSSETTETLPAFPAPLEPVIEESSELVSSDEESICRFKSVEKSISNSTFIDKISRMNYSEESANINFSNTPRTASSNVSLNLEKAEQKHGYIYNNNENLCTDLQHMKLGLEPGDDLSRCDSFTEILDFGNWREHHQTKTDNECVNGDRTLTAKTYDCSSKTSHRSKKRRFMTREERNQRKHEFQELWEDHITFFNNKDETLSDTESAINETAETTPGNATNEPQEIFHGRSMVIKRLFSDPPESVQNFQGHMDACVSLKPLADTKSVDDSDLCYSLNVDESKTHDSHDFIKSANLKKLKLVDSSNYCTPFNPLHKQNSKRELIFRSEPHEGYDDGGFLVNDLAKKNVSESVLDPLYQAGECLLSEKKSQVFSNSTHALVPEADTIDYNKAISPTQLSNLNCDQEKNFNSLERIILEKIETNQLNKSEEIFHKIQSTIRNKLTPSKIDELLQKQKQLLKGDATDTINFELTSSTSSKKSSAKQYSKQSGYSTLNISRLFPENSNHVTYEVETETSTSLTPNTAHYCKKPEKEHQVNLKLPKKQKNYPEFSQAFQVDMINFRRSRSLILCQRTSENKFSYSPLNQVDSTSSEPKSTHSTPEIRRKYGKMDKRNFVLENIRNAAIPQYVKRLQRSITSSVLSENPCSSTISNETKNNNTFPSQIKSDVPETNVYTFQTKLVRGSPRFWVSMSQTPTKKLQGSKHFQIRHKSHLSKLNASSSSISTGTISDFDKSLTSASCSETNVDAELAALSLEIEDVKPHLECYERKLDDYGDHVAECARNMHECVEVQLDIEKEHKKLRNDIFQNHYSEDISCKVQTFSLSETED